MNEWGTPVPSAKVVLKLCGTVKVTTYTNTQGYYSISCYSSYFPEVCTLIYSKTDYSTETNYAVPVNPGGTVLVPDQFLHYVEKWAVIVGIRDYYSISKPQTTVSDANKWDFFLQNDLGFESDHIIKMIDDDATEGAIKNALISTLNKVDNGDIFCFIFAGHGDVSNGIYYLLTWEYNPSGEAINLELCGDEDGMLTDYELAEILNNSLAERILVYLEACHSGGFHSKLEDLSNKDHIFLAAACSEVGIAHEDGNTNHGCFTQCFLIDSWENTFDSNPDAIFNDTIINNEGDLVDVTLQMYQYHLERDPNKYHTYYYSENPKDWPLFYDWYSEHFGYFYLSSRGIDDPK